MTDPTPTVLDNGGAMEHRIPVEVTTHDGRCYDAELFATWNRANPLVLTFHLHSTTSPRSWEAPITRLVQALNGENPVEQTLAFHSWRNDQGQLSQMVSFGAKDKRLFQAEARQVALAISVVAQLVERLHGGVDAVVDGYLDGGTAALEMLANGGLQD